MKYVLMIYAAEKDWKCLSQDEQGGIYDAYMKYTEKLSQSGKMLACEPLEPTATATTVRVRDGKVLSTDGPFAETKEQLGGIYVIDVKDLNEAMEWAAGIPDALHGSIEIRPVMDVSSVDKIK
jgi:hypothetical protein